MIVIDASAMVEALVGRDADDSLLTAVAGQLAAPHLLDAEVLSVLRGLTMSGKLAVRDAEQALVDLADCRILRHPTAPLTERVWQLRHNYSAYDAHYLALAEGLGVPLYTCDGKLAGPGRDAEVRLFPRSR